MPPRIGLQPARAAGVGVLATPIAARVIARSGSRAALLVGSLTLVAGSLLVFGFTSSTSVFELVAAGIVIGIPNGFNNLGLQAALYEAARPDQMGAAGGLFQTFRYVGAILATSLLGVNLWDVCRAGGVRPRR